MRVVFIGSLTTWILSLAIASTAWAGARQKPAAKLVLTKVSQKGDNARLRASFSGPGAKQVATAVAGKDGKVRWNPFTRRHSATRTIHLDQPAAQKVATKVIGKALAGKEITLRPRLRGRTLVDALTGEVLARNVRKGGPGGHLVEKVGRDRFERPEFRLLSRETGEALTGAYSRIAEGPGGFLLATSDDGHRDSSEQLLDRKTGKAVSERFSSISEGPAGHLIGSSFGGGRHHRVRLVDRKTGKTMTSRGYTSIEKGPAGFLIAGTPYASRTGVTLLDAGNGREVTTTTYQSITEGSDGRLHAKTFDKREVILDRDTAQPIGRPFSRAR